MERVSGAGAAVQAVGDSVEFVLTVDREVRAFRQILPQQPVGVFASTALPGTVRVAEVHLHAGGGGEALSGCWPGHVRWRDEEIEIALSRSPFPSRGHQLRCALVFP